LAMSSPGSTTSLPSGLSVLTTFPDVLFIPEIIFGGLVWILVASSKVPYPMLQGWVMFVSVFCFVMSTILLCLYICNVHGGSSFWVTLVSGCDNPQGLSSPWYHWWTIVSFPATAQPGVPFFLPSQYVFAFLATLVYVIHKVFSLLRWKSS
ncbi:MAL protein, partial [Eolophus roseicapillus]|nr:MAL protein [Eolophus roseicapilla]